MNLVDVVQRLGIDHHFKEQIDTALKNIQGAEFNSSDLHEVSLRFRLLRQHGLWVPADQFDKFRRQEDGSFSSDIADDPKGLLGLYNAASLLIHGEEVLEEALLFARRHLESIRRGGGLHDSPYLSEQVGRSLKIPLPRTLKRLEAVSYIPEYSSADDTTYIHPEILELARLDFNLLQHVHQNELRTVTQWWKGLCDVIGPDYGRDRIVECYFWAFSMYYEEEHARARMILARLIMLASLLDDTFDDRATLQECRELNKAIERWDESDDISLLPECIQKFFLEVIRNFAEFEDELEAHEKYRVAYARKAYQLLSKSYLQEVEWCHQGYTPSFDDHVSVSTASAGIQVLCVGMLVGMGDAATKEVFEWMIGSNNRVVRACAEVTRFMDDMADFKRGKNKTDVATTVECYMKEQNVTGEVAFDKIGSFVEDAWKTLNQAALVGDRALLPVVQRVAGLAMSMMVFFHGKIDRYTDSEHLKETLEDLFVNHVPLC
ncbi:terpene synthase8 [Zea mays]|nr:terpene synthase8 [Zea mays]